MNTILAVAIGGAAGSVARYFTQVWAGKLLGMDFPWGTLAVNVLGSFTMGVLVELFALRWSADSVTRAFLTIGVLGGYTTFSSFSLDMMVLVQRGDTAAAGGYLFASLVVSFAAIFGGLHLVRWMLGMSGVQAIAIAPEDGEIRLDRWFKRHFPTLGHGRLEKLLRTGQVRIDGKRAHAGDRVTAGQIVRVPPLGAATAEPRAPRPAPAVRERDAEALRERILYQDDDVIALNKPPGLAVQGGTGTAHHLDGLLDALRFEAAERPRLVHRLDKDTSGVLLLARNAAAAAKLASAFRAKTTRKTYWAVVVGVPRPHRGRIDLALAKLPGRAGEKVAPDEDGQSAVTYYSVIEHAAAKAAFLALMPVTGRTHQLRAHCLAIGTPILGDGKYGGAGAQLAGVPGDRELHLHARSIVLPHPQRGTLSIVAPLPAHMAETWRFLGFSEEDGDPFAELAADRPGL